MRIKANQRLCTICSSPFIPSQRTQKVCSFECRQESDRNRARTYRKGAHWQPKELTCNLCKSNFIPDNPSQRYHIFCGKARPILKTVFWYFQICPDCKNAIGIYFGKYRNITASNEKIADLFYSFKRWCKTCKNKVNDNRRSQKPNKAEKFICDCLQKYFPNDDIVLLDRRQIRYKGWWWEIDVYNRAKKFGFEYDDPKHDYGLGKENNLIKDRLCKKKNIKLIRINWKEKLTEDLILSKLRENKISIS